MFKLKWLASAAESFEELRLAAKSQSSKAKSSKALGLFKQIEKALQLLESNPRHPGLQTHPYSSLTNPYDSRQKVFEAYAQNKTPGAYRIFWCYGPDKNQITIIAITPHP